jgi:hypothetical protein
MREVNLENPYAISSPMLPAGIGQDRDFGARRGRKRPERAPEVPRVTQATPVRLGA